jgi:protein O-mannosyl-transferase
MTALKNYCTSLARNNLLTGTLIVILTVVLYSNTFRYGILYNYDDDAYILDTRISELTLEHTSDYFSTYYLGMYQPIPVLSYAVLLNVFPGSVEAQRITNVLLHCLNAILVFILVFRTTKLRAVGWLTALFFAIHPMHVESVSWLATRGNLVYSCFFLISLIFFIRWREENKGWQLLIVLLSFVLALFSKVTSATLPFVLLSYDLVVHPGRIRKSWYLYLSMIVVSGVFIRAGILASGSFGHITELSASYSLPDRCFMVLNALWLYLAKALVPYSQSVIYLFPWPDNGHLLGSYYFLGALTLLLLGTGLVAGWRNRSKIPGKALLLGLLFFLITIGIVLPLKWSRTILIAERYTYIPYIGLFAGLIMICRQYYVGASKAVKIGITGFLAILIVSFGFLTYQRNKVWENPLTLFGDVVKKNRSNAEVSMGYYNCGNEFFRLGKLDDALTDFTESLKFNPGYAEAYYNRALTRFYMGDYPDAILDFSSSIRINDHNPDVYVNRGLAYRSAGKYELALADFDLAISRQQSGLAYFNRGALNYFNLGDTLQACNDWKMAQQLGYPQAEEVLTKFCNR